MSETLKKGIFSIFWKIRNYKIQYMNVKMCWREAKNAFWCVDLTLVFLVFLGIFFLNCKTLYWNQQVMGKCVWLLLFHWYDTKLDSKANTQLHPWSGDCCTMFSFLTVVTSWVKRLNRSSNRYDCIH